METEQISLDFLEEAKGYLNRLETIFLTLKSIIATDPQKLDEALRLAHSLKGGAAMMQLKALSQVAHRLEDFLKILRIRLDPNLVDQSLETFFLQGIDVMRQIGILYQEGQKVDETWVSTQTDSLFEHLQERLGTLSAEDEDALLRQEGDTNPALLLFENGVGAALDQFESRLLVLDPASLRQELAAIASELTDFSQMAQLNDFVELCFQVEQALISLPDQQVFGLAKDALRIWRQGYSMVLLNQVDKLANLKYLLGSSGSSIPSISDPTEAIEPNLLLDLDTIDFSSLEPVLDSLLSLDPLDPLMLEEGDTSLIVNDVDENWITELAGSVNTLISNTELADGSNFYFNPDDPDLSSDLTDIVIPDLTDIVIPDMDTRPETVELPELNPSRLDQDKIDASSVTHFSDLNLSEPDLLELTALLETIEIPKLDSQPLPLEESSGLDKLDSSSPLSETSSDLDIRSSRSLKLSGQTVRIPVEYLQQINQFFGQLILERNQLTFHLGQLNHLMKLMRARVMDTEQTNTQLRRWYDRASLEGMMPMDPSSNAGFDALEMDRYTDLHILSQAQMESIVQLYEVNADISLTLQALNETVGDLNQTTRVLQGGLTRSQMIPFEEMVDRLPRVVRDLSIELNKPVALKIEGEKTLIDREVIEALRNPLLHLVRNAFDHGIEDAKTRQQQGKPAEGKITLTAVQRGTQTLITVEDDGQGINFSKIRNRLRRQGISEDHLTTLSEHDLLETIFSAGFTTADALTELSGRGVGLDIVRESLKSIRGTIQVETQPGKGSKFTIRVPFALAIARIMILEAMDLVFAVPVDSVKEIISCPLNQVITQDDQDYVVWRQQPLPLIRPEEWQTWPIPLRPIQLEGKAQVNHPTALIVEHGSTSSALYINRFWGEQEVTIRPIMSPFPLPGGVVAATLLGDGRAIPLIDPAQLLTSLKFTRQTSPSYPASFFPVSSTTILIVDDSVNVRRYLAKTLEKEGYQVEQAKDGQEAVEKLLNGLTVQAVICDIEMPRLNGYGVLSELKSQPAFQRLPIAMLTSRSNDKHRRLAIDLGADAYLSKPYNEQHLLSTLKDLLHQSREN
jgi:chemosensory pili system protein ChpA (sensor histidine kinase/response regulator)